MPVPPCSPSLECFSCRYYHAGCDTINEKINIGLGSLCASYERQPGVAEVVPPKKFYFGAELIE